VPTHTYQMTCSDGATVIGGQVLITDEVAVEADLPVVATTPDQSFALSIPYLKLASLAIEFKDVAGNNLAATIEINSATTPAGTITLTATGPFFWVKGQTGPNPITADITTLFVTPGATAGTLKVRAIYGI
jgi:hypothetical protein